MKRTALLPGLALGAALSLSLAAQPAQAVSVGLELLLLTDVSSSVSNAEYDLQKGGYVAAFQNPTLQAAIQNSAGGSIAVKYIEWGGANQQAVKVDWTLIDSAASANAFAAALNLTSRSTFGGGTVSTAPGSAINFAVPFFSGNGYEGSRLVIDVSGDGAQNNGADTATARDNALAGGVNTINGLPILGENGLLAFYQNNIQGGTGSFTLPAADFASFQAAIQDKLVAEITGTDPGTGIPEPASLAVLGFGLLGLGLARRSKGD